jgi:uncharacterized protein (DUF2147 family)
LWTETDAKGRPLRDSRNPDRKLRDRALKGTAMLSGFRAAGGGKWRNGRIYNPEDGRSYTATLTLVNANSLAVEGCALMFCQTQVWRRLDPGGAPL